MNEKIAIEIYQLQFKYPNNLTPTLKIEELVIYEGEKYSYMDQVDLEKYLT